MLKSNPLCGLAGVGSVLCVRGFQPFGLQPPVNRDATPLRGVVRGGATSFAVCSPPYIPAA